MKIKAYLKPQCGWSNGVRAILRKHDLAFEDIDIINNRESYAEMVRKSGQPLSPCVEVDGVMLADISGEEVENYLLSNDLVKPTDATIDAPSAGGSGQFGFAVAVGKLNGDAYDDLLVGAPNKFSADGRAYVFPANSDGSGLTTGASPTVTLTNQAATERFGYSVLIADWSDDGTNGVVIGAPTAPAGGTNRGSAYWFNDPLNNQVVDETVSGLQDTEWLARSLAGGRFSNDAYTVVAIGAYLWNDGADADSGRVVVATVPEPLTALLVPALALPPLWRRLRLRRRGVVRQQ
jgi:monothiol glutaredoxin